MNDTYANYMSSENQKIIRKNLFKVLKENPRPIEKVAQAIGISKVTLFRFLKDEQDVDFIRLTKIETWISKK